MRSSGSKKDTPSVCEVLPSMQGQETPLNLPPNISRSIAD